MPGVTGIAVKEYDRDLFQPDEELEALENTGHGARQPNLVRWRRKRDEQGNLITDDAGEPQVGRRPPRSRPLSRSLTICRAGQIESNARMVEWEDGTLQLLVGDHAFRLDPQPRREGCVVVAASHRSHGETVLESHGQTTHRFRITAGSCVPPTPGSLHPLCFAIVTPLAPAGCVRRRRWCDKGRSGRSASGAVASRWCTTLCRTRATRQGT